MKSGLVATILIDCTVRLPILIALEDEAIGDTAATVLILPIVLTSSKVRLDLVN